MDHSHDRDVSGARGRAARRPWTSRGRPGGGAIKSGFAGQGEGGSLPAAGALLSALKPRVRG